MALAEEVAEAEKEVGRAKANAPPPPAAPAAGGAPRVPGLPKSNDLLRPKVTSITINVLLKSISQPETILSVVLPHTTRLHEYSILT